MDENPSLAIAATCVDVSAHSEGAICHSENLAPVSAETAGRADFTRRFQKIHGKTAAVFPKLRDYL